MGTEVRIGVLTGLLIVVVAGVYFFYGRNRDSQDLEIVTGNTPVVVPTIPSGRDVKPAANQARTTPIANSTSPRSNTPNNVSRPVTPSNPAVTGANSVRSPVTPPTTPGSMVASGNSTPNHSVFTPVTASTGTARPVAPQANTNSTPLAAAENPISTDASRTTLLRTSASSGLKEATQRNLEAAGAKPATTPNIVPSTVTPAATNSTLPNTGTVRLPDSLSPVGPKPVQTPATNGPANPAFSGGAANSSPKPATVNPTPPVNPPVAGGASHSQPQMQPANRPDDMKPTPLARPTVSTPSMQQPKPAAAWPRSHVIASGETLSIISEKYYDSTQQIDRIMKANPSLNPRRLKIGDVVSIPAPDSSMAADGNTVKTNPAVKPSTAATVAAVTNAASAVPTPAGSRTYTVRSGDTLYSIAAKTLGDGKKWKQLFDKNRGVLKNDAKRLKIGMVLTLP